MTRKIRKAAVIGSGVMGSGIAALLASAGVKTLLLDIVPFDLSDEEKNNPAARNKIVQAGFDGMVTSRPAALMSKDDAALIRIGNLEDDFDLLADCDWIVEVVVENLEVKQALFSRIEKIRKADAIVSTNTSGLPLSEISKGLGADFKKHFMGTHFFNPVRYMHLLELIPGEETDQDILDFMEEYGSRKLGKGIVWCKDTPNFIANRIGVFNSVNNMHTMVEEGMSITEVDAIMGPAVGRAKTAQFGTSDLVGLDILYHISENTYPLLPNDSEQERFKVPAFFKNMVENNLLGNKAGGGFYKKTKTDDGKRVKLVINPDTLEYAPFEKVSFPCLEEAAKAKTLPEKIRIMAFSDDRGSKFAWKCFSRTWIYAANRIPEISDTVVAIDNAMRWGFNAGLGPFEMWDAAGLEASAERMKQEGMDVPESIMQMLDKGCTSFYKTEGSKKFYYDFASQGYVEIPQNDDIIDLGVLKSNGKTVMECASASLIDLGDGVFCCEFHTKMNALNAEIKSFMGDCLEYVDKNGVGLVYGNQAPRAFSAGADLKAMRENVAAEKFDDIAKGIKEFQDVIQQSTYSAFPVVAAPFGMALGGGCEVCLGADRIVTHAELYMGLVEIGAGLLPGGGGCMNLWKKMVARLGAPMNRPDLSAAFGPVFNTIATAKVSTSAAEARINGYLGENDRIVFNRDFLIAEAKKEVLRMVEDGYTPPAKKAIPAIGEAAHGMIASYFLNMTSGGYVSEYDAFLAKRIAYVVSGGEVANYTMIDEDVILTLERETFVGNLKQEKTVARIDHLLKTGRPLRN